MHIVTVVIQATNDAFKEKGSVASANAEGTIPVVLLIAECINIVINKLLLVRQYNHAIATDIAVTLNR